MIKVVEKLNASLNARITIVGNKEYHVVIETSVSDPDEGKILDVDSVIHTDKKPELPTHTKLVEILQEGIENLYGGL